MTNTTGAGKTPQSRPTRPQNRLPYFDPILEKLREGDPEYIETSGRHVHWGYWPMPLDGRRTAADLARAQELMAIHLCARAGVGSGQSILDAGCGFGGTVASINERHEDVTLVGVNIDERQLERAREQVVERPGNVVRFVLGDACELPFANASFDNVLAVECIMHFPDRFRFMQDARRVLRPGGRLTVSDFCPVRRVPAVLSAPLRVINVLAKRTFGPADVGCSRDEYGALGRRAGFASMEAEDITVNTLPTYSALRPIMRKAYRLEADWVTAGLQWASRVGLLRYMILSFDVAGHRSR